MGEEVRLREGVQPECCCLLLSACCSPLLAAACAQKHKEWMPRTIIKKIQNTIMKKQAAQGEVTAVAEAMLELKSHQKVVD